jgi:hypothetical protein
MTIQITQLANLQIGSKFRTSRDGVSFYLDGYDSRSRCMHITKANGDICQMRPRMKVFYHDEATY